MDKVIITFEVEPSENEQLAIIPSLVKFLESVLREDAARSIDFEPGSMLPMFLGLSDEPAPEIIPPQFREAIETAINGVLSGQTPESDDQTPGYL